jgi:hypothetical protein
MNNRKIIIINGKPRAGKDIFCKIISDLFTGNVHVFSSVVPAKKAAKILGWDGIKNEVSRKFISDLKDLSTNVYNHSFEWMKSMIECADLLYQSDSLAGDHEYIIFFHIREPEEIEKLVMAYPDAYTLLIKRPELDNNNYNNHADSNVDKYDYDRTLVNDGSLNDLTKLAMEFLWDLNMSR